MRQTWVKTSQYPCVISPNPVGHSDKVMKTLKGRSLLNLCIMHPITILIIFIYTEYSGNSPVGNSSYQAGKPVTLSVRGIVQLENDISFFDYQNCQQIMLTGVAEGYWHVHGGKLSFGLLQGAPFTQILCNSLFRLWALSDISAYLTRTAEKDTTRVSIVCPFIRTVLVVRWHHIRAIALT